MRSSFAVLLLAWSLAHPVTFGQTLSADEPVGGAGVSSDDPLHTQRYGFLKVNRTRNENPAPYVLTDPWGQVKYYVTVPKGMEVEPYLNRHVAIRGSAYQRKQRFDAEEIRTTDGSSVAEATKSTSKPAERQATETVVTERSGASESPARSSGKSTAAARTTRSSTNTTTSARSANSIALANHQEMIETPRGSRIVPESAIGPELRSPGQIIEMDEGYEGELIGDDWAGEEFVEGEGPYAMDGPWGHGPWAYGPWGRPWWGPNRFWVRAEYMLLWKEGMRSPPLVTTSPAGTARDLAGVMGVPGTTVLYGGDRLEQDPGSGVRVKAGMWFNPGHTWGIEGEYWGLAETDAVFQQSSTGNPILARPFYDAVAGRETAELVAFPAVLQGTVTVSAVTDLQSAGARFICCCCCQSCDVCDPCDPCAHLPRSRRIDWLMGYRYLQLDDTLSVREDLVSVDPARLGTFVVRDTFDTRNQFNGFEFGVLYTLQRAQWSLELLSKLGLGNTHQKVTINGTTDITQNGATQQFTGGLLAQRTNIGVYERDQFSVVPEINLTLGCQITPRLKATVGYTFIYWSNVVRPGDQIDREVNPELLPPENPLQTTHLRPEFAFRDTNIWLQGLHTGLELRW